MNGRWVHGLMLTVLVFGVSRTRTVANEPVRVYTNEDVERLAPLETQPAPLVGFDRERFEFVIQFLEDEYRRLGTEGDLELAWAILRAEAEASERRLRLRPARGRSFLRSARRD